MSPHDAAPRHDRLDFVDALRGVALMGIFAANLILYSGYAFLDDAQRADLPLAGLDGIGEILELVLVENKFLGLFSFLFGVSFWLFLKRPSAQGKREAGLYYWRIFWLFVIGSVHGWLFWCYDVLRFYALWGLTLPLFLRLSRKALLYTALAASTLIPALISGLRIALMPPSPEDSQLDALTLQAFANGSFLDMLRANWIYDWYLTNSIGQIAYQIAYFGRMLLGVWVGRELILENLRSHKRMLRTVCIVGLVWGIPANLIKWEIFFEMPASVGFALPFCKRMIAETGFLSLTLAYVSGLALIWEARVWERALRALACFGRMALTSYLTQTLVGFWIFYGFMPGPGLMGTVGPAWLALIWATVLTIQIWVSGVWLRHFRYGPAEWLWRVLTYRRMLPLRIGTD